MRKLILYIYFLLLVTPAFCQLGQLDEKVLKYSDIVILESNEELDVQDDEKMEYHFHQKIWVKNKDGLRKASLVAFYDESSSISNLEGSLLEKGFKKPKKFKTEEIVDVSTSPGAADISDQRVKYIEPTISVYPAVIEYSYTKTFDGTFVYPKWYPVSDYNASIVSSSFTVKVPSGKKLRIREKNINKHTKRTSEQKDVYEWNLNNFNAQKYERKSLPANEFLPYVSVQPYQFIYEDTKGSLASWNSFGDYISGLNKNTRDLSQEVIDEVKALTKDAESDLEKARIIYEYMQSKTRYVSIQLGIGGLKPMNSSLVDSKGYGDCKGLSNYTYNLMKELGVDARYVIIKGGRGYTTLDEEMVGSQFNHAILCLPNIVDQDTVWLECTSQTTPFGYMGSFTGNRKALLIEEGKSKIVSTKQYTAEDNAQVRKTIVKLKANNSVWLQSHISSYGFQYDNYEDLARESEEELKKQFSNRFALSASSLLDLKVENDKSYPNPSSNMDYTCEVRKYSQMVNNGFMIPLFPFKDDYGTPKRYRSRKTDFVIDYPYSDVDSVEIHFLEGMKLSAFPEEKSLQTDFGSYSSKVVKTSETSITYIRKLTLNGGVYSNEKYNDYYSFMRKVNAYDDENYWVEYSPAEVKEDTDVE